MFITLSGMRDYPTSNPCFRCPWTHICSPCSCCEQMRLRTEAGKKHVGSICSIVDAKGWGFRLATRNAMRYVKGMAENDSLHYPEVRVRGRLHPASPSHPMALPMSSAAAPWQALHHQLSTCAGHGVQADSDLGGRGHRREGPSPGVAQRVAAHPPRCHR